MTSRTTAVRSVLACAALAALAANVAAKPPEFANDNLTDLAVLSALGAATIEAADLLDLGADLGTIEAGKIADLVVMNGDPLTEPTLWADPARVVGVVQAGRVVADRR